MNATQDRGVEEYEVIPSAESTQFGVSVLGMAIVLVLIVIGALGGRYPVLLEPSVWVGVGATICVLAVVFRKALFGATQLKIGRDRILVVSPYGAVQGDIPYQAIAEMRLFHVTMVEKEDEYLLPPLSVTDAVVRGARRSPTGMTTSLVVEQPHLGFILQDYEGSTAEDRLALERARGAAPGGFDWMIGPDQFQAPVADIEQKIRERWQAFLEKNRQ